LEERGCEVNVVRYLENGILEEDLPRLAQLDGIVRKKEAGAEVMASLQDEEDIMNLLRTNPKVLERPVLISGQRAVIGRPPEDILSLLDDA
jgi:arsenate reductase